MSKSPKIYCTHSLKIEVTKGQKYQWCACGHSNLQPFCDNSHEIKETGFKPISYVATETKIIGFCGCKHTKKPPICDGSHKMLKNENL